MNETKPIQAVEMVRRIRDDMARELEGKSDAEIIAFFKRAGDAAREAAKRGASVGPPSNKRTERPRWSVRKRWSRPCSGRI